MERGLDATFFDDTPDDGVNNPRTIYYCYSFWNESTTPDYNGDYNYTFIKCNITKYPVSNEFVKVEYLWGFVPESYNEEVEKTAWYTYEFPATGTDNGMYYYPDDSVFSSGNAKVVFREQLNTTEISIPNKEMGVPSPALFAFRVTLKNADVSLTEDFDAGVSFDFTLE